MVVLFAVPPEETLTYQLRTVLMIVPLELTATKPPLLTTVALAVPPLETVTLLPFVTTNPVLVTPFVTTVLVIAGHSLLKTRDGPISNFLRHD